MSCIIINYRTLRLICRFTFDVDVLFAGKVDWEGVLAMGAILLIVGVDMFDLDCFLLSFCSLPSEPGVVLTFPFGPGGIEVTLLFRLGVLGFLGAADASAPAFLADLDEELDEFDETEDELDMDEETLHEEAIDSSASVSMTSAGVLGVFGCFLGFTLSCSPFVGSLTFGEPLGVEMISALFLGFGLASWLSDSLI